MELQRKDLSKFYDHEQERIKCLLIEQKDAAYFSNLRLENLTGTQPDLEVQTKWIRVGGWWKTPKLQIGETKQ